MTNAIPIRRRRLAKVGLAAGAATATVLAATATPVLAAAVTVTTNPAAGPTAHATPITVSANNYLYGVTSPAVIFSVPACPATFSSTVTAASATAGAAPVTDTRKVTDSMLAVTAPVTVVNATTTTLQKWNVCVYANGTNGANIGKGTYTVGTSPTATAVSPGSGPAGGGNSVVITGTAFPTTIGSTGIISATIDGLPLTSLKSISDTAFSGVMPTHAAGKNLTLSVNTAVGTVYLQNAYSYQNGVGVTPNTAPNSAGPVDVAITGSNLLTPTFPNGASTASTGHVYLVQGIYDPTVNGSSEKTNGPVAECTDVLVFDDNDLICRMQLWQDLATDGTINAADTRQVGDLVTTTGSTTVTSATANFTQADVGLPIAENGGTTHLPASEYITAVLSPTTATVTTSTGITTGAGVVTDIGGDRAALVGTMTNTIGSNTIVDGTAEFLPSDVGRQVTGTGGNLPAGTIITSVSSDKTTVTLSRPSVTSAITALSIKGPARVPNGAYVVTVANNGAVDAQTNATYDQSVVSSSSTFTVANY
jgi:IPT/TIG domain-containing protein